MHSKFAKNSIFVEISADFGNIVKFGLFLPAAGKNIHSKGEMSHEHVEPTKTFLRFCSAAWLIKFYKNVGIDEHTHGTKSLQYAENV